MRLSEWMNKNELKQKWLAELLGCDASRAHRIFKEKLMPHEEEMQLIYKATKGTVDANSFFGIPSKRNGKK